MPKINCVTRTLKRNEKDAENILGAQEDKIIALFIEMVLFSQNGDILYSNIVAELRLKTRV